MDITPRDTVTVGDITDDSIDEGDILFARPTKSRTTWESCRIGDDEVTLTLKSHIVLHHAIAVGATMDSDDESGRIRYTITRRYSEDIAPSLTCYSDFVCTTCERSWTHTSLGEISQWGLFYIVFSDAEYELTCLTSGHR